MKRGFDYLILSQQEIEVESQNREDFREGLKFFGDQGWELVGLISVYDRHIQNNIPLFFFKRRQEKKKDKGDKKEKS